MYHLLALFTSIAALGIILAIFYGITRARPGNVLGSDLTIMIETAVLTGLIPIAFGAAVVGLSKVLTDGFSMSALLSGGIDLVSLGVLLATLVVFGWTLRAAKQKSQKPSNVVTLSPQPPAPRPSGQTGKKAA